MEKSGEMKGMMDNQPDSLNADTLSDDSATGGKPAPKVTQDGNIMNTKAIRLSLSLWCIIFIGFVSSIEYSVVMPSLQKFLDELECQGLAVNTTAKDTCDDYVNNIFGWTMACFSIALMVSLPLCGMWADRRPMREVFLFTIGLGFCGNILYGIAWASWVVVLGRSMAGLGAGNSAVALAYIAAVTESHERTPTMAKMSGFMSLGMIMGPAFNLLLNYIDFYIGSVHIDQLNGAGYLTAIFQIGLLVWFVLTFTEPRRRTAEQMGLQHGQKVEEVSIFWVLKKHITNPVILVLLFQAFVMAIALAAIETVVTPITNTQFKWTQLMNSIYFAGTSVVSVLALWLVNFLSKRIVDRWLLSAGQAIQGISFVFLLAVWPAEGSVSEWMFILFNTLLIVGNPFSGTAGFGLFSKIMGNEPQGTMMGFMQLLSSIGRILGPIWTGYTVNTWNGRLTFVGGLVLWCLLSVVIIMFFRRLVPVGYQPLPTQEGQEGETLVQPGFGNDEESQGSEGEEEDEFDRNRHV